MTGARTTWPTPLQPLAPKLRIFTDRGGLPPGVEHIEMLYPFLGNPRIPARDPIVGDFARYIALGPTFFELTSLDTADVCGVAI